MNVDYQTIKNITEESHRSSMSLCSIAQKVAETAAMSNNKDLFIKSLMIYKYHTIDHIKILNIALPRHHFDIASEALFYCSDKESCYKAIKQLQYTAAAEGDWDIINWADSKISYRIYEYEDLIEIAKKHGQINIIHNLQEKINSKLSKIK
jgi:hypothetical protein